MKFTPQHLILASAMSLVALPACTVGPDYESPSSKVPAGWAGPSDVLGESQPAALAKWWDHFGDPRLSHLIQRAALANKDIQRAVARIDEARALAGVAEGARFPQIDANSSYTRQRFTENGAPELSGTGNDLSNFSLGLDASWEVDVFGRIRRSVEAARAGWEASIEDYRAVSVVLFADVATTYIGLRTTQERLSVAQRNRETQRRSLDLARARLEAELVSQLDVTQARTLLADTEASIPPLREAEARAINRLGVLLGQNPGSLRAELAEHDAIPAAPRSLLGSTPAEVIRQRPDIQRVERELAAQTARIGIAEADLYPRFSITGSFAFQAEDGSDLLDFSSRSFSIGPAIRWSLFNGGRIRSLIAAEHARARQALVLYEQTVLTAVEDVENAIEGVAHERDRFAALTDAAVAAGESTALSEELYREGLADYQRVLDAQRSLFQVEDAVVLSRGQQSINVVSLYRAFGGGWRLADAMLHEHAHRASGDWSGRP